MLDRMLSRTWMSKLALAADGEGAGGGTAPAEGDGKAPQQPADGGQPAPQQPSEQPRQEPKQEPKQQPQQRRRQEPAEGKQDGKQPEAPTKPDWMPDKLWGDGSQFLTQDGSLDTEAMGKALSESYRQAENKIFTRKDDLKKEVAQEIEQERRANVPESPDRYQPNVPEGVLPENAEVQIDDNDPILQEFKQTAHDIGLTQDQFDSLFQTYLKAQTQALPDVNKEIERLGDHGPQRLDRVERWMQSHLSESGQQKMQQLAVDADTVALFEEVMELAGEPKFQTTQDGEVVEETSMEELKRLQGTEEYRRGDPATVRKVRAGYQKLAQQRARGGR